MSFDPEDRLQDKGMHGPQEPSQEMTLFVQDLLDQMVRVQTFVLA